MASQVVRKRLGVIKEDSLVFNICVLIKKRGGGGSENALNLWGGRSQGGGG